MVNVKVASAPTTTQSVTMTERYAHLAPENLVDAVSSLETRLHFGSTADVIEDAPETGRSQIIDMSDERWWARKDSNLRPMDYESNSPPRAIYKSITYAHRSHANAIVIAGEDGKRKIPWRDCNYDATRLARGIETADLRRVVAAKKRGARLHCAWYVGIWMTLT